MKLLLTSQGWDENIKIGKELLKLIGKSPSKIKILIVITPEKAKLTGKNKYIARLSKIGFARDGITFFELDKKVREEDLKCYDVVFVAGGNVFEYLYFIKKTGLEKALKIFVKRGGVYLGLSAGSYVACPSIKHVFWKPQSKNLIGLKNFTGLCLIPFFVIAHFEKKWQSAIEKGSKETKLPVFALTDKQAISVNGKKIKIIGRGKIHTFNFNRDFVKGRLISLVV
jgi:dipeptidase E